MEEPPPAPSAFQSTTFDRDVSIRVNEPVGSASISPSNRDVVLASREGLHIIDLDAPYAPPLHLPHYSPWEVADVQWSPFASRDYWICSTSNQKVLVWNLNLPPSHGAPIEHTLHAHTRAITDINFSAHHPDILATCAVDSFVHCWDLRRPNKPVITFADFFAGATQVKWNRQDSHIIASSHDRFLRIWDERKGAQPLHTIEAHSTKIYGIDWNRTRATCLITCSLDKTIKFWDYAREDGQPDYVIKTPFPVWRARHTPFGWGVLAMPQRGDHDLHLYDRRKPDKDTVQYTGPPAHSFQSHDASVKEFLWRSRGSIDEGIDNREFQLISWGQDRHLNLHKITDDQLAAVGHVRGSHVRNKLNITRKGAVYKSFREERLQSSALEAKSSQPQGLGALIAAAGMSKAVPHARGVAGSAPIPQSIGMHSRKRARPVMNPIKWMEGVTIGKKDTSSFHPHFGTRSSILLPDLDHLVHYDTPESLGDEVTYVGLKYQNVHFEQVDVARRMATLSVNGPWGAEGKSAFLRLGLTFPEEYPASAMPEITLETTFSFVSEEIKEKLRTETHRIAEHYCEQKKGCLEALVIYLLGERSLDDSLNFLDPDNLKQVLGDLHLDIMEESSDEDDEDLGDFSGVRPQDGTTNTTSANANIPLPKECGAIWARNGRLVCFFPPKADPKPLFSLEGLLKDEPISREEGLFEGFGRLRSELPGSKKATESSMQVDDEDELEDWTSTSSSSSSSSSESSWFSRRFAPPLAWKAAPFRFQRSSQPSTGGVESTAKAPPVKPKTIVTVRDMDHLLPSKRTLAEEYAIYGAGPSICEHNATVAANHSCEDLADIWHLVKMILYDEVPLDILPQTYRTEPILVMARRAAVRIKRKDSGLNLNYDLPESVKDPKLTGHVKWGTHPVASAWLIPKLFDHFERLADIQMLAMLSCIFCEPAARESAANALMRLHQPELPISMKAPAFSLDYFPSPEVAWSLFLNTPELRVAGTDSFHIDMASSWDRSGSRLDTYGSAGSSNGVWASDQYYSDKSQPTTPRSNGLTPPTLSRSNTYRSSGTGSFSTSPEQVKDHSLGNRKSFSNLATRMIPFTLSSSPDTQSKLKKDAENTLSMSAPKTVGWGGVDHYEVPSTQIVSRKSKALRRASSAAASLFDGSTNGDSGPDSDAEDDTRPPTKASSVSSGEACVKVTLKNQNMFGDEGHASVPLLNKTLEEKCKAWRQAYADILLIWQLPMQMAEVLKFNGLTSYWPEEEVPVASKPGHNDRNPPTQPENSRSMASQPGTGKSSTLSTSPNQHNYFRSSSRTPVEEKSKMSFEKNRPASVEEEDLARMPTCRICWETILGLHVECPACEWRSHKGCLAVIQEEDEGLGEEVLGCECDERLYEVDGV